MHLFGLNCVCKISIWQTPSNDFQYCGMKYVTIAVYLSYQTFYQQTISHYDVEQRIVLSKKYAFIGLIEIESYFTYVVSKNSTCILPFPSAPLRFSLIPHASAQQSNNLVISFCYFSYLFQMKFF